ncbi:MAG TPA: hypothetical protein EYM84_08130 [Flavobacteriales bacterium]|nr:hypothetical protein [Flavobacteriales bacterium]
MLIDDLNSNLPETAGKHWEKAREIDNVIAKRVFAGEYSQKIGAAYVSCIKKYRYQELGTIWDNEWETLSDIYAPSQFPAAHANFMETMQIAQAGLGIAPDYINLHLAAAVAGTIHLTMGTSYIDRFAKVRQTEMKPFTMVIEVTKYPIERGEALKMTRLHIDSALRIDPQNKKALEVQTLFKAINDWEPSVPGGCFIATAAYGTPFADEIDILRNWRDDFLEASYPGRLFIKTYYSLSPPVADNISESDGKRKIVRTALGPIVKVLKDRYSN